MTQNEMVLRHLETYGSITAYEAMEQYGIMRLAARISNLKDMGHDIGSTSESKKNRFGEKVTYSRYHLLKGVK